MKTRVLYRICVVAFMLIVGQTMWAQDAFYIYRNDGEFNGFFYDDVKSMRLSKIDLDLTERDEYVVQEIELADTTYRIPLCAIDSIGFQQPEIIFSKRFYNLSAEDCPYKGSYIRMYDNDGNELNKMACYPRVWDGENSKWIYYDLPKVGDVLYIPDGEWDGWSGKYALPFVGKVTEVKSFPEYDNYYEIHYDYVDSFGDVFEQFVTLEQIGHDDNGVAYSRMAGLDKLPVGISGNKDLTLAAVSGKFTPINQSIEDLTIKLSVDLDISIKANVAYNITSRDFNITMIFKEDAEVGASLTVSGTLEETLTWQLGGVPLYFPSFMPILQVRPGPGAFLKTAGDMSLTINTPKLALHSIQTVIIDGTTVTGYKSFYTGKNDENNTWGIQLSLNGSAQAGTHFPFKIETASWCKKIAWCSTGIDVYAGPKFDASFTLDPVALVKKDAYSTLGGTQIKFSPVDFVIEGNAIYSAAGRKEKKLKVFEAEQAAGTMMLRLFPEFNTIEAGTPYLYKYDNNLQLNRVDAKVLPRGNSIPFKVGMAAYNYKDEMVSKTYGPDMYSFFNTFDELPCSLPLLCGRYNLVPILNVLGYDVPVWEAQKSVECTIWVGIGNKQTITSTENYSEGTFVVTGLMKDDDVEFELVSDSVAICNGKVSWGEDLRDHQEQTESKGSCGLKVEIYEDSMGATEKQLGPEEMGPRTFHFRNNCTNQVNYSGDITPSGPNKSKAPGSYTYVSKYEYNILRAKVTRNGIVRYSPNITFSSDKLKTIYN